MFNLGEIFDRAKGKDNLSLEYKATDNAKEQVRKLMLDMGCPDPEQHQMPKVALERYCEKMQIGFDASGNITSIQLPSSIEEIVYRKKDDRYLRDDIMNELVKREDSLVVTKMMLSDMVDEYKHLADCNVPYNATIETVVDRALEEY